MPDTHHPCGTLPVVGWALTVWWCVHHQAWWASAYWYDQRDDGEHLEFARRSAVEFGPFDDRADIERWMAGEWLDFLNSSVRAREGATP